MGPLELAIGAWLLFGRKSTTQKIRDIESGFPTVAPFGPAPASTATAPITRATIGPAAQSDLVRRANQPRAKRWVADFVALGVPPKQAEAYARWVGIESSGNPLAVSPIGERGLFQITTSTAKNTITPAEWEAMIRPTTSRAAHALMALAQAKAYDKRARKMVKNWSADPISAIWYQKAWHARPGDFRSGKMHGDARQMAQQLQREYAGDSKALRRLHAANVIAFGTPIVGPSNG